MKTVAFILSYDHYTDVAIPMVEQPSASQSVSDVQQDDDVKGKS